jgi:hypothetical protein
MEVKLKERLFRSHTLPMMRDSGKAHRKNIGMTSANVAGISAEPNSYERSRAYSAHVAEIEIKRAQALAEAYRLSLR